MFESSVKHCSDVLGVQLYLRTRWVGFVSSPLIWGHLSVMGWLVTTHSQHGIGRNQQKAGKILMFHCRTNVHLVTFCHLGIWNRKLSFVAQCWSTTLFVLYLWLGHLIKHKQYCTISWWGLMRVMSKTYTFHAVLLWFEFLYLHEYQQRGLHGLHNTSHRDWHLFPSLIPLETFYYSIITSMFVYFTS